MFVRVVQTRVGWLARCELHNTMYIHVARYAVRHVTTSIIRATELYVFMPRGKSYQPFRTRVGVVRWNVRTARYSRR